MREVDSYQKSKRDMCRERGVVCSERTRWMVGGGWWWQRYGYGDAHCLAGVEDSRPEFLTRTQTWSAYKVSWR